MSDPGREIRPEGENRADSRTSTPIKINPIVPPNSGPDAASQRAVYVPSTVEKRKRRTRAELDALDEAIVTAVTTEHPVTLRGVFYRVVSAGGIDKTESGYRVVGRQLGKLRRSGDVPWHWITDGTRLLRKPQTWQDVDQMLDNAAASYRRTLWDNQDAAVIVLSEKDAISGTIFPVTAEYDVELGITRGYTSDTFVHSVAEDIVQNTSVGITTYLYQLGDHDPSGVDGWRDFADKIVEFAPHGKVLFERLAVTREQIDLWDLPTRPTKRSDTRAAGFRGESVEVDAVPANTLRQLVRDAIERHLDPRRLEITRMVEDNERYYLRQLIAGDAR